MLNGMSVKTLSRNRRAAGLVPGSSKSRMSTAASWKTPSPNCETMRALKNRRNPSREKISR